MQYSFSASVLFSPELNASKNFRDLESPKESWSERVIHGNLRFVPFGLLQCIVGSGRSKAKMHKKTAQISTKRKVDAVIMGLTRDKTRDLISSEQFEKQDPGFF